MKKIILVIVCFFAVNVYAENLMKDVNYTLEIGGKSYSVTVRFQKNDGDDNYKISSIIMKDEDERQMQISSASSETFLPLSSGFDCKIIRGAKTEFTSEEIESGNYLPTFIKFDGSVMGDHVDFLYYIPKSNEELEKLGTDEQKEKEKLTNLLNHVKEQNEEIEVDGKGKITMDSFPTFLEITGSSNIESDHELNPGELTPDDYIKYAETFRGLVEQAKDIKICTEDDLNKLRTLRNVSLFRIIDVCDDIMLSSPCYNIIFGDGLGGNNLYNSVRNGYNYVDSDKIKEVLSLASYLYYESYYLEGVGILEGSLMQQETVPVVHCNWLGDKTTELIQQGFNVLKYAGIIIGVLLAVVDVVKVIARPDGSAKEQYKVFLKRIAAIIALILTPIIVEVIFEVINTIGIDDPICGIR